MPRNPAKPGYFANYGLAPSDDAKLTAWMRERLQVAVWQRSGTVPLEDVGRAVLRHLNPPLNIAGVQHAHRASLQAAEGSWPIRHADGARPRARFTTSRFSCVADRPLVGAGDVLRAGRVRVLTRSKYLSRTRATPSHANFA